MARMAYSHSCTQAFTSFVATPRAHHLRTRLDRFRILLVSHPVIIQESILKSSAVMKLYALFTLHETGWGTRAGVGDRTFTISGGPSPANTTQLLSLRQPRRNSKQHQAATTPMLTHAKTRSTSSLTAGSSDESPNTTTRNAGCFTGLRIKPS